MPLFGFLKRKPRQLEMSLRDDTRSQGSIAAERKSKLLESQEQIITRKKLLKRVPKLQITLAERRKQYEGYASKREEVKRGMELITDLISQKTKQIKLLQQNITDISSSKRMGTAARQDEIATAKDPSKVPKINPILQEMIIQRQSNQVNSIQSEVRKLHNRYGKLMATFEEFNTHTIQAQSLYAETESQLNDAQRQLAKLTN